MFFNGRITPRILTMLVAAVVCLTIVNFSATTVVATPIRKTTTDQTPTFSMRFRSEPNHPRKKDMKIEKLNRLIGSDYNEFWMSKTTKITADGNVTGFNDKSKMTGPDNLQFPEQLPVQYQEMMRSWLVHRSSCQVEYSWMDLGKSFWPRWIKIGRCSTSEMMSCSWPPGMSCAQSSIKVLNLLRWHCWSKNRKNPKKNQGRKFFQTVSTNKTTVEHGTDGGRVDLRKKKKKDNNLRCLWIKVPYPVTEDCMCSCRKVGE